MATSFGNLPTSLPLQANRTIRLALDAVPTLSLTIVIESPSLTGLLPLTKDQPNKIIEYTQLEADILPVLTSDHQVSNIISQAGLVHS